MNQEKSECIYPDCKNERLKNSKDGYCIFHAKAEDKDERQFKEALEEYINEIKANQLEAKDSDYNFRGFIFVGDIGFIRDFMVTVFTNANFGMAKFQKDADFMAVEFQGDAEFGVVKFQRDADFEKAKFQGDAKFGGVKFQRDADFMEAKFQGNAYFGGAKFQGDVNFLAVEFQGDTDFMEAAFRARTYISPKFIKREISFIRANLENISLTPLYLEKNALIDFTGARLRNTDIRRKDIEGHIIQEQEKDFSAAKEIYLLLKNNFHTLGRYDDESWAFQKEREIERKSYFKDKHYLRWASSKFLSLLYGYGEKPQRPLIIATGAVFFFAFIFRLIGIFDVSKQGSGSIWDCLYFSVVTFTTLGYGDVRPLVGAGRIIAAIEAFTGVILMALFIFSFARRTGGR